MWLLHSFGHDDLCKQMINDLIWQHFCNCCIFYATKGAFFGISERCFLRAVKIRWYIFLRNLREAALHTGARAEEAEDRGLELLHSAETEAELKKLEEADSDTLSYVKRGLNRIAFGAVNDAVKLVFDAENMTARDIMGMDLFNVSEIKISGKNVLEIKFFDRQKALEKLGELAPQLDGGGESKRLIESIYGRDGDSL